MVSIANDDADEDPYNFTIEGLGLAAVAEINVTGDGVDIPDDDTTPDSADHTDFGGTPEAGGQLVRTFTVENSGTVALSLTGTPVVAVSGTHSNDFTVTLAPTNSVASGTSTTFQVTFDPSALGLRTATLSIANDDPNEDPYDFAIQGTGHDLVVATGGDTTQDIGGYRIHTFLSGGTLDITAGGVVDVLVVAGGGGGGGTIGGGGGAGGFISHNAYLVVSNGYTVTVGTGGGGGAAASSLQGTSGTNSSFGALIAYGGGGGGGWAANPGISGGSGGGSANSAPVGSATNGQGNVAGIGDGNGGGGGGGAGSDGSAGTNAPVSLAGQGGAGLASDLSGSTVYYAGGGGGGARNPNSDAGAGGIGGGGSGSDTTFGGAADPNTGGGGGGGAYNAGNQAGGAGGSGIVIVRYLRLPVPEINVTGNELDIPDGETATATSNDTDFGTAIVGISTVVHTFTIENTDNGTLSLTGTPVVAISGTHSNDFTVTVNPTNSIAGMTSTTFQVTFDPLAAGARTGTVSIANNDADENPYDFMIEGLGVPPEPEMNLTGNGEDIADSDSSPTPADHTDFESAVVTSGTVVRTFTIENTGDGTLSLTGAPVVVVSGTHSNDFTVSQVPTNSIAAGTSTTFQVTFDPSDTGTRTATLSIANDDSDEDPYDFAIEGLGTAGAVPEISVSGNGQGIADGDTTPTSDDHTYFGVAAVSGDTVARTYTIENIGLGALSLTGTSLVVVSGTHSGDFTVSQDPANSVAASGSTTFEVTFDPLAAGTRTATLSIANNDADEDPYNFAIQGYGDAGVLTSYDPFPSDPNIAGAWTEYVYWTADQFTPTWNSIDKDLDLSLTAGGIGGASGLYRSGTSRLPTDTVTLTVTSLGRTSGAWGFVGAMISAVAQPGYTTTADDTYSLLMIPESATHFHYEVRKTYLDGTPPGYADFVLTNGPTTAFTGPYTNEISRVGDHYEFRANGALLYTTATPAVGDFYDLAARDSMAYYQIVMGANGSTTATVDDFGVPVPIVPAVTLDGSASLDSIAGNAPVGTLVGPLSMINTNPAGFAYSLDAGDTTYFDIPGGTSNLLVKAALGAGPYALKIVGTKGGFSVTNDFVITVAADISVDLSHTNMTANASVSTQVGILSMVDAVSPEQFAFSLHASGDTTHFDIPVGTNTLVTDAPLSIGTYDIVILATNATDGFWVTNAFTIAVAGTDPLPAAVQYWRFDAGSGSIAFNSVPGGNTGTLVYSPTWINTGLEPKLTTRDALNGPSTAALDLDPGGTADYVDGGNISLTSTGGGGEVTVSMWLNPDSLASEARLFTQSTVSGATSQQGTTDVLVDGRIAVWNGGGYVYPAPVGSVIVGVWQHLAFVWDSGQVTAYVDGVQKSTATANFEFGAANGDFGIAADLIGQYGAGIDGKIDDVAIFDVALNQSQVVALANGEAPPVPQGTLFLFR
jgi:hypothetical protein